MKNKIYISLIIFLLCSFVNVSICALEGTEWDFRDPDKITSSGDMKFVSDVLNPPYEDSGSTEPGPLSEYTFGIEGSGMTVNLGKLDGAEYGRETNGVTFLALAERKDKFAVVKRGDIEVGKYRISDLLKRSDRFEAKDGICRIDASKQGSYIAVSVAEREPQITARYAEDIHFVYITASELLRSDGDMVNIALIKKDAAQEIGYFTQTTVKDGEVSAAFKFTGNIADFTAVINDGHRQFTCGIEMYTSGVKANAKLLLTENEDGTAVTAELSANDTFYGTTEKSLIRMAIYDESGALLECKSERFRQRKLTSALPKGAKTVKAFVIESYETMRPQTLAEERELGGK